MLNPRTFLRALACLAALTLMLVPCATAETDEMFDFNGARWGMTRDEVRALVGVDPYQEPSADDGRTGLVYAINIDDADCLVQYSFLPEDALYNIEIMSVDTSRAFYNGLLDAYTARYGEPLTGDDASADSGDPVAMMLAMIMEATSDTDLAGWLADVETVIVLSRDEQYGVTYVEFRRYTDFFHIGPINV